MSYVLRLIQVLLNILDLIIRASGQDPTPTDKTVIWKVASSIGTNPILGTGCESFRTSDRISFTWRTGQGEIQAHNVSLRRAYG